MSIETTNLSMTTISTALYKMCGFQPKIAKHAKRQGKQPEETKQLSESDLDMTWLLEVSENEFRMIMVTINMLNVLIEKVDKMQGQIGNFSRDGNCKKDSNG